MKIEYLDEDNFYVYINKICLKDLELKNKDSVEKYFKKLFMKLKNNYQLDIYGYYNIRVYENIHYGIILDILKLSNDYFKLPNNKVDMKIMIDSNSIFLYEIDDYFFIDKYKSNIKSIYYKDEKYYVDLNDEIDDSFYLYLLEHSNILFNDDANEILISSFQL
jgi:hypothetical protein